MLIIMGGETLDFRVKFQSYLYHLLVIGFIYSHICSTTITECLHAQRWKYMASTSWHLWSR